MNKTTFVVLVEPGDSLNIGSVARAMKNLGFTNLIVVSPPRFDVEKARATACWATDVLDSMRTCSTLEEALYDMEDVVGFAMAEGKNRAKSVVLPEWAKEYKSKPLKTALLFGPEDTGLRLEHLQHCRLTIRIPSNVDCPSFNLAQAVLLALYEINQLPGQAKVEEEHATWNDMYQLDRLVTSVAERSRFYRDGTPSHVPDLVKTLFRRMSPSKREAAILLGLFGKIEQSLKRTKD